VASTASASVITHVFGGGASARQWPRQRHVRVACCRCRCCADAPTLSVTLRLLSVRWPMSRVLAAERLCSVRLPRGSDIAATGRWPAGSASCTVPSPYHHSQHHHAASEDADDTTESRGLATSLSCLLAARHLTALPPNAIANPRDVVTQQLNAPPRPLLSRTTVVKVCPSCRQSLRLSTLRAAAGAAGVLVSCSML
jgi:hypothetical protein